MAARNSAGRGSAATATKSRSGSRSKVADSDISRLTVNDIREELRKRGIPGIWALRKPELVKRLTNAMRSESRRGGARKTAPAKSRPAGKTAPKREGGARTGGSGPRTLRYAQEMTSPADRPERPGRSLITTHHEVIRRWARERGARPATIEGTERGGRPGVLTFDFPGYRSGGRLKQVPWTDWFRTFDGRRLNFIYQEQRSDGRQSNFFRVENPDREDA